MRGSVYFYIYQSFRYPFMGNHDRNPFAALPSQAFIDRTGRLLVNIAANLVQNQDIGAAGQCSC